MALLGLGQLCAGCFLDYEQFRPRPTEGGGGTGGEGGGPQCVEADCDDDNPCTTDECQPDGSCSNTPSELTTIPQPVGDCKEAECSDQGVLVQNPAPEDTPLDDGNPCTDEVCNGDQPAHPELPEGTMCNEGFCTADGVCSSCVVEANCGDDTDCVDFSCDDNRCSAVFNTGMVISDPTPGDCLAEQCVGREPLPQNVAFDDPFDDGNGCTIDACDGDMPTHEAEPLGTACEDNLDGGQCSGTTCVDCTSNSGCDAGFCLTTSNTCEECLVDGDCPPASPVCDSGAGGSFTCVDCTEDGDCTNPTPNCDTSSNTCVGCVDDADCAPYVCNTTNDVCVVCIDDGDCTAPGLPVCDTSGLPACVECAEEADCSGGEHCHLPSRTCQECVLDSQCPVAEPFCSALTCVECQGGANCASSPSGTECISGACACNDNPDCSASDRGHVCILATLRCGCVDPVADCPAGLTTCNAGVCAP